MCLPGYGGEQGRLCALRGHGELAGGGHRDWGAGLLGLCGHVQLCRRLQRRLWRVLQCGWQGCSGEAGRGQPAGQWRWRCVQAGGILYWRPCRWVILLLALLLSGQLGGLRGGRHPSCKIGKTHQH